MDWHELIEQVAGGELVRVHGTIVSRGTISSTEILDGKVVFHFPVMGSTHDTYQNEFHNGGNWTRTKERIVTIPEEAIPVNLGDGRIYFDCGSKYFDFGIIYPKGIGEFDPKNI